MPIKLILPKIPVPVAEASEQKGKPIKSNKKPKSSANPLLFQTFFEDLKIENPGESGIFIEKIKEALEKEYSIHAMADICQAHQEFFSDPHNVTALLSSILETRTKTVIAVNNHPPSGSEKIATYLFEAEKRRKFMGQVIACLHENFFKFSELSFLRLQFIDAFSEDLRLNADNIAESIFYNELFIADIERLHGCLTQAPFATQVYDLLFSNVAYLPPTEALQWATYLDHPSLHLLWLARIEFAIGGTDAAVESLCKESQHKRESYKPIFDFLEIQEETADFVKTEQEKCKRTIVHQRLNIVKANQLDSIRNNQRRLLALSQTFRADPFSKKLNLEPISDATLYNFVNQRFYLKSDSPQETLQLVQDGISLLDTMMDRRFDGSHAKSLLCEEIAKKLIKLVDPISQKNKVIFNLQKNLKAYLEKLEEFSKLNLKLNEEREHELKLAKITDKIGGKATAKAKLKPVQINEDTQNLRQELTASLQESEKLKGKLHSQKEKAKGQLNRVKEQNQALELQLEALQKEFEAVKVKQTEFESTMKTLAQSKDKIASSQDESISTKKIAKLKAKLANAKRIDAEKDKVIKTLEDETGKFKEELKQKNRHIEKQGKRELKITNLKQQLQDKDEEIAKASTSQAERFEREKEALTNLLKTQYQRKEAELKATQAAYEKTLAKAKHQDVHIAALSQDNRELTQNNLGLRQTCDALGANNQALAQTCQVLHYNQNALTDQLGAYTQAAAVTQEWLKYYSELSSELIYRQVTQTSLNDMDVICTDPCLVFAKNPQLVLKQNLSYVTYYLFQSIGLRKNLSDADRVSISEAISLFANQNLEAYFTLLEVVTKAPLKKQTFEFLNNQKLILPLVFPEYLTGCKGAFTPAWRQFVHQVLERIHPSASVNLKQLNVYFISLVFLAPYAAAASEADRSTLLKAFVDGFKKFSAEDKQFLTEGMQKHLSSLLREFNAFKSGVGCPPVVTFSGQAQQLPISTVSSSSNDSGVGVNNVEELKQPSKSKLCKTKKR